MPYKEKQLTVYITFLGRVFSVLALVDHAIAMLQQIEVSLPKVAQLSEQKPVNIKNLTEGFFWVGDLVYFISHTAPISPLIVWLASHRPGF